MSHGLFAAILISIAWNLSGGPNQRPANRQKSVTQKAPSESITVSKDVKAAQYTEPTSRASDKPRQWYASPEWVLVIVGIITFSVISWQSWETRKSAQAGLLSAQASINAERPWLMPIMERRPAPHVTILDDRSQPPPRIEDWDSEFTFLIRNDGATPAHILSVVAYSQFTDNGKSLPDTPDYRTDEEFEQQRILSPKDPPLTLEPWTLPVLGELVGRRIADAVLIKRTTWWWRYGRIRYRNVLDGSAHETRFCWLYVPDRDEFIVAGPTNYTKYT
jgi:hypothetical protein